MGCHGITCAGTEEQLEVPTIKKAYFLKPKGILPGKYGQKYGTNVPPFQDPEIPIEND